MECLICLKKISDSYDPCYKVCGHYSNFCMVCLNKWREKNNSCPLCRKKYLKNKHKFKFSHPIKELIWVCSSKINIKDLN